MRLKNRIAIVTGAGSGLGKAIATRLAAESAMVVVAEINLESMHASVRDITAAGGKAVGMELDVRRAELVKRVIDEVVARFGRIDILVNNAGITRYRPFAEINDADWNTVLDVDLKGVFFCSQAVAPHMARQRYGKIVSISSSLGTGTTPHHTAGSPGGSSAYAAAKAAVIQLTKTLARELGPSNVNVNAVAPGFFLTPLISAHRTPAQVEDHIAVRTAMAVLNRPGKLEELADVVLFLASDESSFVTGHTIPVDGGRTDRM